MTSLVAVRQQPWRALTYCPLIAALIVGWGDAGMAGQGDLEGEEGYVATVFKRQVGEVPRMGWFLPGAGFVAAERHEGLTLLTDKGSPARVAYAGIVSPEQRRVMKERFLACETYATDPLFAFTDAGHGRYERALFTTRPLATPARGGLTAVPLSRDDLARVDRALAWTAVAGPRWDGAFAVRRAAFFYSIHRRYDAASKELHREAVVLHDATGAIVAFSKNDNLEEGLCDGCGLPSVSDGLGFLYRVLNMFELPGYAYPLLLLDTSTIEGRALSLTTFTPEGRLSSFRQYEYAFTCGLPDDRVR